MSHPPGIDLFYGRGYFTITENMLPGSTSAIREIPTDDILHLMEVTGPAFHRKPRKPKSAAKSGAPLADKKPRDETRSGRAYRLACRLAAHGKGKQTFLTELYADLDGAAWANEARPYDEDHAWDNAVAKFGWAAEWHRNKNGAPLNNLDNVLTALRHAEVFAGLFARDEMLRADILMKRIPNSHEPWIGARPVRDVDVIAVQELLQENWLVGVSRDTAHQAVALVAEERKFHPVVDYLKRL